MKNYFRTYEIYFRRWIAEEDATRREIIFSSLFLCMVLIIGTFGYALADGWSIMDGLFMTFITVTTVGYGEVHPLTTAGRLFSIIISVLGIATGGFILTRIASLVLKRATFEERQMYSVIKHMDNHFIICGCGRVGRRIAKALADNDRQHVLIDQDKEVTDSLRESGIPYVLGNAEDAETLHRAGLERAQMLILALPTDRANAFIILTARELSDDIPILARLNDQTNRNKLLNAGVTKIIAPEEVGADRMSQVILRPHVHRLMEEVLQTGARGLQMQEIPVHAGGPLAGRPLADDIFAGGSDVMVVGIVESDTQDVRFNPASDQRINAGDVLILLGEPDAIERLRGEAQPDS